MKKPKNLTYWDFPDTKLIPNGWNETQIPEATTDNFNKLLNHYNNLVDVVNELAEKNGIKFEDEDE